MAKVIVDKQGQVEKPWWDRTRIVGIGAALGLGWWVATSLLNRYIIEPLGCRDLSVSASTCTDSFGVAGNVAVVLIALAGFIVLVRGLYRFPIIITGASAVLLWGLGSYLSGLAWYEAILWSVLLYAATYSLFYLIGRIRILGWVIVVSAVTVLLIRFLLSL